MIFMLTLLLVGVLTVAYAALCAASDEDDRQDDYWIK